MLKDMVKYKGHWVCCLGCQQSIHTQLSTTSNTTLQTPLSVRVLVVNMAMSMPITRKH